MYTTASNPSKFSVLGPRRTYWKSEVKNDGTMVLTKVSKNEFGAKMVFDTIFDFSGDHTATISPVIQEIFVGDDPAGFVAIQELTDDQLMELLGAAYRCPVELA